MVTGVTCTAILASIEAETFVVQVQSSLVPFDHKLSRSFQRVLTRFTLNKMAEILEGVLIDISLVVLEIESGAALAGLLLETSYATRMTASVMSCRTVSP